ncbi:MAG TPA: hypothetical protein VNF69_12425 [Burkholderiales bacterium]|nr:hypothetical protein [Burkholderiales bacterium]
MDISHTGPRAERQSAGIACALTPQEASCSKLRIVALAAASCALFSSQVLAGATLLFNVFVPHRFFVYPVFVQ